MIEQKKKSQIASELICKQFDENFTEFSRSEKQSLINKINDIFQLEAFQNIIGSRKIVFCDHKSYTCEYTKDALFINTDRDIREVLYHVVRKGRILQTHKINMFELSPEHAIAYYRSLYADFITYMIKTLWEMKLAQICPSLFHEFENFYGYSQYLDMFLTYENMSRDFRNLRNNRSFFETWAAYFVLEKPKTDKECIKLLLQDYSYKETAGKVELIPVLYKNFKVNNQSYIPSGFLESEYNYNILTTIIGLSNRNFVWFLKFEVDYKRVEWEDKIQNIMQQPSCKIYNFKDYVRNKQ